MVAKKSRERGAGKADRMYKLSANAPGERAGYDQMDTKFRPQAFLDKLVKGRTTARFKSGETIYAKDQPAEAIYFLEEGLVSVTVSGAAIGVIEPGQFFGETCLDGASNWTSTTVTLTPSRVVSINKEAINLLLEDHRFLQGFIGHLVRRHNRIEADFVDQLFNPSEKRLARLLLLLAHINGGGNPRPIPAAISQEMLAEMIGTTRPRVNEFMTRFRSLGYIKYNGTIEITNAAKLAKVSETTIKTKIKHK
jgi:CRP/FNR family transcriptional regulator, cyclic AMP receptor protein